jgi:hypothetical protein
LTQWINSDRAFISWRNQLRPRISEWRTDPDDDGTFLRGRPLQVAEKWLAKRGDEINDEERLFVARSASFRDEQSARANDELKKKLAKLSDSLTREHDKLMVMLRSRADKALKTLYSTILRTVLFVSIIISQAAFPWPLLSYSHFSIVLPIFAIGFSVVIPMLLKYALISDDWFVGDNAIVGDILKFISTFTHPYSKSSVRYYVLIVFLSAMISF